MYKRRNIHNIVNYVCKPRIYETFENLGYEFNEGGFIRNDFSQLQERENELGFARALSQMREYVEENTNDGKTFEEIVASVRPRWCQLNGEIDRFEQYLIDNALDFYKKLRDKETDAGRVAAEVAEGTGVEPTSEPARVN